MALTAGTRLEHYEIVAAIGAGGMGEVYRARDTKLGRDVAFKVLPEAFAGDADRLSRFQREAQILASLNHPNIAQIFGLAESPQARGIVMELIQGETLQARLKRGPVPVSEAIHIARQIAEALEAAHDRDIVHRDLKPGNIMLPTDSSARNVKVLDFGLAKALEAHSGDVNFSNSPTVVTGQTYGNVLLGTAAYMSPEQVRGQIADERSDIWAFGCVFYEMLTGSQPFTGDTVTDLIGGIVRIEPDWNALPASTPAAVRSLVKGCLEKDRRRRFHAIGDVRIELENVESAPAAETTRATRSRERVAWAVAGVFVLATIALFTTTYFAPATEPPLTSRFLMDLPSEAILGTSDAAPFPAVSPDGRYVTFVAAAGGAAGMRLWLRPIGALVAQSMAGTEGIGQTSPYHPFWSADGRFIAFNVRGKLLKVAVAGGPPQILCDANGFGGTWNQDNVILFDHQGSIHRVAAGGGISSAIRTPDKSKGEIGFRFPSFLPDGRHFVFVALNSEPGRSEVRVGSLDSNNDKPLFSANSRTLYSPPGYLLFVRAGTLMVQPFDAERLETTGDIFPVAEQVASLSGGATQGGAAFGVSANGTLVYRMGAASLPTELTWFDRSGRKLDLVPATGNFINPSLSPDEKRIAVEKTDGSTRDIWLIDLTRGTTSRFTFDPSVHQYPVFSPDGQQILFVSDRSGTVDLYIKPANGIGEEQLLLKTAGGVSDWSADGKTILYATGNPFKVWALPTGGDAKPFPVVASGGFQYIRAKFSPDGRWVAYTSNETGRNEIYVQTFPPSGGKWQVSVDGGEYVYWRRDGKELIVGTIDRRILAVDVKLSTTFEAGVPRKLFDIPGTMAGVRFAITADGQRFLVPLIPQTNRPTLTTVLNWTADIKR